MKANLIGLVLTSTFFSSSVFAAASTRNATFKIPGEVAGVTGEFLYTPAHPALALEERASAPCPHVQPSFAGDFSEGSGWSDLKRGKIKRPANGSSVELAATGPSPELSRGGIALVSLLAPLLFLGRRRN